MIKNIDEQLFEIMSLNLADLKHNEALEQIINYISGLGFTCVFNHSGDAKIQICISEKDYYEKFVNDKK